MGNMLTVMKYVNGSVLALYVTYEKGVGGLLSCGVMIHVAILPQVNELLEYCE